MGLKHRTISYEPILRQMIRDGICKNATEFATKWLHRHHSFLPKIRERRDGYLDVGDLWLLARRLERKGHQEIAKPIDDYLDTLI